MRSPLKFLFFTLTIPSSFRFIRSILQGLPQICCPPLHCILSSSTSTSLLYWGAQTEHNNQCVTSPELSTRGQLLPYYCWIQHWLSWPSWHTACSYSPCILGLHYLGQSFITGRVYKPALCTYLCFCNIFYTKHRIFVVFSHTADHMGALLGTT